MHDACRSGKKKCKKSNMDVDFWFPIFVAGLSIFLAWFFTRLLEEDDKDEALTVDEDEELIKKIKVSLNPDKVVTVPATSTSEEDEEKEEEDEEEVAHSQGESLKIEKKEALKIEDELSPEDKETERTIQQEQLHSIFELMGADKEKYGDTSFAEVKEEMKRYQTG